MASSAPAASASHSSETPRAALDDTSPCCWNGKTISLTLGATGLAAAVIALIIFATPVGAGIVGTALLGTAIVLGAGGLIALIVYGFLRCKNQDQGGESPAIGGETLTQQQIRTSLMKNRAYGQLNGKALAALKSAKEAISSKILESGNSNYFDPGAHVNTILDENLRASLLENSFQSLNTLQNIPDLPHLLLAFIKSLFTNEPIPGTTVKSPLLHFLDPNLEPDAHASWWSDMTQRCKTESEYVIGEIATRINSDDFEDLILFIILLNTIAQASGNKDVITKIWALHVLNPIMQEGFANVNWTGGKATWELVKKDTILAEFIIDKARAIAEAKQRARTSQPTSS